MESSSRRKAGRQQPERDVVHARERHVRRADHDRHHPVGEAADQRRHDHEEDHDQRMAGGEHVEHVLAAVDGVVALEAVDHLGETGEDLDARLGELPAHHHRQEAADDARDHREDQVERADVLVVGRIDPADPTASACGRDGLRESCSACHVPLRSLHFCLALRRSVPPATATDLRAA
jgi:hypothetical protein